MRTSMGALVVAGATVAGLLTVVAPAQAAPARTWEGPMAKSSCMAQQWKGKCVYIQKSNEVELESGWYIMR
ncbi:hypothetical protein QFZ68_001028 [Streptomyces sp. V1I6]|nr:hypothetical protein [Streptomyces sp. V1I6]